MQKIYNSPYQTIEYDLEYKLLYVQRKSATDEMEDEDYKTELRQILKAIQEHQVCNVLVDERNFNFPIIPELQQWVASEIFPPAIASGVQKLAFIKSHDLFVNVSVEQALNEVKIGGFTVKYFEQEAEALAWVRG